LIEPSIVQQGGITTLQFTKILEEPGEIPIIIGPNTFLGAYGSSNVLGYHAARLPIELDLLNGNPELPSPPDGATIPPGGQAGGGVVALQGGLAGATLDVTINQADARAGGQDTVTIIYEVPEEAWVGIGFSNNGGLMVGSEAVLGQPDEGVVQKWILSSKAGIEPMPDTQQTLIEPSIVQQGGITTLQFTKILEEPGEIPIIVGPNTFLGAYGSSNAVGYHSRRESFAIDLLSGGVEGVDSREKSLWQAHGWFAAIAWGFLSPMAIGVALVRKLFKGGLWFKIHQALNISVVLFTIIAFGLAVAAISKETPSGASANHFSSDPFPHRKFSIESILNCSRPAV